MLGMDIIAITSLIYPHHVDTKLCLKGFRDLSRKGIIHLSLKSIGEHTGTDEAIMTVVAGLGGVTGILVNQGFPFITIQDASTDAIHAVQIDLGLLGAIAQRQHEMVNIDFLLTALIGLGNKLPVIARVLGHVRSSEILLVTLKFSLKCLSCINSSGLGISNLLFVEHKAFNILLESFFLDLLLIVLVVKIFKL